jgi:hypothetical protein
LVGLRLALTGSVIGVSTLLSGCPTEQQWFQIIGALLPIVSQTYLQFFSFAKGGVSAGEVTLVQNLTTSGQDLIKKIGDLVVTYQTTKSAGVIAEINALLTQARNDVDSFLADAQIKNSGKLAQYSAFAQAILADIQDIVAIVPIVVPVTSKTAYGAPTIVEKMNLSKAQTFEGVFKSRLAGLPK